jgi:hypothetical protein
MAGAIQPGRNLSAEITGDRLPSPAIWQTFPMYEHLMRPGVWFHWFDDFHNVPELTTNTADEAIYASFIDTSDTIRQLATEKMLGVLRLSAAATDNNGPVVTMGGNNGASVLISDTAGDDYPLWLEARWRKSSITANQAAMFLGLCEEARAVNNGLLADDTGVLADIDHIGFNVAHDAGAELNWAYTKAGQTDTEVIAALDTIVADTWYKHGFYFNPSADTAERIGVYVNNSRNSTFVTGTNIAAATFPDGEEMTFAAGVKAGEATAVTLDLDWIRLAQEIRVT